MRDKTLDIIDQILEVIKNSEEYQKYIEVSNKMQNNKKVMALIKEIKDLQKSIVKKEYHKEDISLLEKDIDEKIKQLEEIPIYLEYTYLQEDLNDSISLIKNRIENYIDKIIN